ncbi:MAG: hypothetical protein IJV75_03365 [Alphaproteobacteria bacterium]|nr:hypothetical protein [Alphaproteobacteria bacterium]
MLIFRVMANKKLERVMDRERELDNLNIMRENGLISEDTYQAQRHALLGTPMVNTKLEQAQKRLHPLSLLNAFKFSFRPTVFGANFVFLFATVMFFLVSVIILFSCLEVFSNAVRLTNRSEFFRNAGIVFGLSVAAVVVFWEAVFIAFFSRLALEQLERDFPPFEWKPFIKKSLALGGLLLLASVIFVGLFKGMEYSVDKMALWTLNGWKQYAIGIPLLIVFVGVIFVICYVQTALMTACIGSAQNWKQTVVKALKKPLLILFALGCLILNGVVMFVLGKGFEYTAKPFADMVGKIIEGLMSISGLGVFGLYLVLAIISFLAYIGLPSRGKFWFKTSFLFVIPSLVILISVFSVLPFVPPLPTSFYFAYFLIMHVFWGVLYIATFWAVQEMAFMAHILTQVWCHLTHDKAGNFLFALAEDKQQIDMPQPKVEEEYQVPEVFR